MIKRKVTSIGITLTCLALAAGCGSEGNSPGDQLIGTGGTAVAVTGGTTGGVAGTAGSPTNIANTGGTTGSGGTASKPNTGTGGGPASSGSGGGGSVMLPADTPLSELPAECKGFEVLGLKNSPGGSVLPNKCAPFDGSLNNPYAIRCIDADPTYKTKYMGDQYCILPPPENLGTQVHVGPADYNAPGEFEFPPDDEVNTYYYINSPNTEEHYYYRANWRMRPGSHHMIINIQDADRDDGWAGSAEAGTDIGAGGTSFGGAQRPDVDRPTGTLDIPPENVGIGGKLAAKQQFSFNLHHMNQWEEPILREAWVNIWYMDESEVTKPMQGLSLFGNPLDVAIDPGESAALEYKCDITGNTRIITILGHRHVSTDRFAVWVKKASGETIDAYESFDWEDIPTYQYDSVSKNPVPDVAKRIDGASSGILDLKAGDSLHFLCDIHNQQDTRLRFANELYTGEMCIVFGSYTGDRPCAQPTRVTSGGGL